MKKVLITGGCGFIGSSLVRHLINNTDKTVINVDKITYAGSKMSVSSVQDSSRYHFEKIDICDKDAIYKIFKEHKPDLLMHLAAESHVDRSINAPSEFIQTNIVGTFHLLEVAKEYFNELQDSKKKEFRFHHISTDEVYGDLPHPDSFHNQNTKLPLFTEKTPYSPSSPYSASKASSDHLVRAWNRTFKLPTVITNCSNNYGPFQNPEKLIPLIILNALKGKPLPIFGNGNQIRDWLYVDDHVKALDLVATNGRVSSTYNIGGHNEKKNIDVVKIICNVLEELAPKKPEGVIKYEDLIVYVQDRSGHDQRYAIDAQKIKNDLGWVPSETFESGIRKTIEWYLNNQEWLNYEKNKR